MQLLCSGWRVQREVLSALLPGGVLRSTVLQVVLASEAVFALYMLLGTLMGGLSPKVFDDVLKLRNVKEVNGSGSAPAHTNSSLCLITFCVVADAVCGRQLDGVIVCCWCE